MRGVKHSGHEKLTLLELVLQLHGEFQRSLDPIRVTPLQAGVLLFLCRRADASLTDATAALCVRVPSGEAVGYQTSLGHRCAGRVFVAESAGAGGIGSMRQEIRCWKGWVVGYFETKMRLD